MAAKPQSPSKPKPPRRRQRRHGVLPSGFLWREGRPRWVPSPARRKQGWKGADLRDAWGRWLAKGPAVTRAEEIAAAVSAWAAGHPVPAAFAAFAPRGATEPGAAGLAAPAANPRSLGALLDAFYASDKFRRLGPKTQSDYRSKLARLLDVLAGHRSKVERLKALDIDILLPPAFGEEGDFELERAYEHLREHVGEHMAHGVMAATSAWLSWCVKKRRVWPTNPAKLVERSTPEGRIMPLDWPELAALVTTADELGWHSLGDAVVLGVDLSWSEQDLLHLLLSQVSDDDHVKHRRIKTGNAGNPPLLELGRARMRQIRARWRDQVVRPVHVIICEKTGKPWNADSFRHAFAELRAQAAKKVLSLADKQFRDLRDTSITYGIDAGLSIEEICSRSLHTPDRCERVIFKHYGAIRQGVADRAGKKLDAHYALMGYTLDAPLALPAPSEG